MRRALLALLTLAVAGPALAGQPTIPAQPKAKPAANLAIGGPAPLTTPGYVLPPPIPLAAARPGGDAGQCRATCAKQLYFCNSGGDDDGCGGRWAQCNASCTATYSSPRFLGAR